MMIPAINSPLDPGVSSLPCWITRCQLKRSGDLVPEGSRWGSHCSRMKWAWNNQRKTCIIRIYTVHTWVICFTVLYHFFWTLALWIGVWSPSPCADAQKKSWGWHRIQPASPAGESPRRGGHGSVWWWSVAVFRRLTLVMMITNPS